MSSEEGDKARWGILVNWENQEEPHDLNRKRLFSQGNNLIAMKSRVRRESQARFCERLVVKFHRPTRQPLGEVLRRYRLNSAFFRSLWSQSGWIMNARRGRPGKCQTASPRLQRIPRQCASKRIIGSL